MKTGSIAVFGGTGLIGRSLVHALSSAGHPVIVFSRNVQRPGNLFNDSIQVYPFDENVARHLEHCRAVINLAGENIAGIWTEKKKKRLTDSRVKTTRRIVNALNGLKDKPEVYLQASAVGYYPDSKTRSFNEGSEKGEGFLSDLVSSWEHSSDHIDAGVRRIIMRFGIVLSRAGGMLPKIALPVRLFAGSVPGRGDGWLSWVHHRDLENAIVFLIMNTELSGVHNLCSPSPVRMKDLIRFCGRALKRPVWLHIPEVIIRMVFGQMGRETILNSQRVIPGRLMSEGYEFVFPDAETAVHDLLSTVQFKGPQTP